MQSEFAQNVEDAKRCHPHVRSHPRSPKAVWVRDVTDPAVTSVPPPQAAGEPGAGGARGQPGAPGAAPGAATVLRLHLLPPGRTPAPLRFQGTATAPPAPRASLGPDPSPGLPLGSSLLPQVSSELAEACKESCLLG